MALPLKGSAQHVNYQTPRGSAGAIDISRPVGTLDGGMSVSGSGAATYSIPIKAVPGTMGIEPKLSLEYNSQGGNGQLGWGWNLSGMSAISRVGSDNYHDGKVKPIEWNGNDFYSLDGSRLTRIINNGGISDVYATESESWSKIESWGWLGSGPEFFTVVMKDGTFCEYGREPFPNQLNNSKVMNNAGTEVLAWKISRITDVNGNYMSFHYTNDGGDHRIAGIWYTGSTPLNQLPYQHVDFNYAERSDLNTIYEGGSGYKSKYLLTSVVCYSMQTDVVRTYSLGYKFTDGYSFLQSVQECGVGNNCFNELQFMYGGIINPFLPTPILGLQTSLPASSGVPDYVTEAGDFNGDGLSDVVQYRQSLVNGQRMLVGLEVKFRSTPGSNPSFIQGYSYQLQNLYYASNHTAPNSYNFHLADFDGDGTDDILLFHINSNILIKAEIISKLYYTTPVHTFFYPKAGLDGAWQGAKNFLVGDFNGDGRMDFLASLGGANISAPKLFITCPFKNPSTQAFEEIVFPQGSIATNASYPGRAVLDAYFTAPVDFDGDGRSEVLCVDPDYIPSVVNKARIFSFKLNSGGTWEAEKRYEAGYPTAWHSILLGDFNGDRKTDLLTRADENRTLWEVAFSTGTNFETEKLSFYFDPQFKSNLDYINPELEDPVSISDYDGDGKSDILWVGIDKGQTYPYPLGYNFNMYYSRGKNLWKSEVNYHRGKLGTYELSGDFTGDGKADIMIHDNSFELFSFRDDSKDRLLSATRNGLGRESRVEFRNLTGRDVRFYESTAPTDYPLNTITVPY